MYERNSQCRKGTVMKFAPTLRSANALRPMGMGPPPKEPAAPVQVEDKTLPILPSAMVSRRNLVTGLVWPCIPNTLSTFASPSLSMSSVI